MACAMHKRPSMLQQSKLASCSHTIDHQSLVATGTNGSGKSAVLQAVQFCLGVSAAKTGRAGANANFIKSGCHEAKVRTGSC